MLIHQDAPDFSSSLLHIYVVEELLYRYDRHTWGVQEPDMDAGNVFKEYVDWHVIKLVENFLKTVITMLIKRLLKFILFERYYMILLN